MKHTIEQITGKLKEVRKHKGLSQRELAAMAGVPQSHISKIERGDVDLRLSSLIEISRALDLEVSLVPRKNISAVQSIIRSTQETIETVAAMNGATKEFDRFRKNLNQLSQVTVVNKEIDRLKSKTRELQRLSIPVSSLRDLENANTMLELFGRNADPAELKKATDQIQSIRNEIAHASISIKAVRGVYSLEGGDND